MASKLVAPKDPPKITTLREAEAFGRALAKCTPIDAKWAPQIFDSDGLSFLAGPDALNAELRFMWDRHFTNAEKLNILAAYIAERLDQ